MLVIAKPGYSHIFRRNIFRKTEGETRRTASADQLRLLAILPTEADRGRVIVQLVKAHTEGSAYGEHHGGQQCRAIGVVEPVQCPAHSRSSLS